MRHLRGPHGETAHGGRAERGRRRAGGGWRNERSVVRHDERSRHPPRRAPPRLGRRARRAGGCVWAKRRGRVLWPGGRDWTESGSGARGSGGCTKRRAGGRGGGWRRAARCQGVAAGGQAGCQRGGQHRRRVHHQPPRAQVAAQRRIAHELRQILHRHVSSVIGNEEPRALVVARPGQPAHEGGGPWPTVRRRPD